MNQEKKPCTCGKSKNPPYCDDSHEHIDASAKRKICTCGKSKNPPYCDDSHEHPGIDPDKLRTKPDTHQDEEGDFGF